MHRAGVWSMAVTFALAIGMSDGSAQEASERKPKSVPWWKRLLGGQPEPTEEAFPPAQVNAQEAQKQVERAKAIRAKEEAAFLRRQEVCLKLMEYASQLGNKNLYKRAQELEDRAWNIYIQRTSSPMLSRAMKQNDVKILDENLSTDKDRAAKALLRPGASGQSEFDAYRAEFLRRK